MKKWIYAVVAVCLLVYMCGGSDESDEVEYGGGTEYEQTSESYNSRQETVSFSSELDVRNYLSSHNFTSSDGYTITFERGTSAMSMNGRVMSRYTKIVSFSRTSAVLREEGIYGNSTFYLDGANGVLTDKNGGETYYAE